MINFCQYSTSIVVVFRSISVDLRSLFISLVVPFDFKSLVKVYRLVCNIARLLVFVKLLFRSRVLSPLLLSSFIRGKIMDYLITSTLFESVLVPWCWPGWQTRTWIFLCIYVSIKIPHTYTSFHLPRLNPFILDWRPRAMFHPNRRLKALCGCWDEWMFAKHVLFSIRFITFFENALKWTKMIVFTFSRIIWVIWYVQQICGTF